MANHDLSTLPEGYDHWFFELKARIRSAQTRAALAVNSELVLLYWQIGREILARQDERGWGGKVIERLSSDLKRELPEMKGFSPRNLKYMRAFAAAWPEIEFVQEVLAQVQQAAAQIPSLHNDSFIHKRFVAAQNETIDLCNKLLHKFCGATMGELWAKNEVEQKT